MPSERIYTEHEITAIFARAAERQRTAVRDPSVGLTLAEVEQAGKEAGLDPAAIRAAAAALDAEHSRPVHSKVAVAERWVDGPLREGAWEDLVTSLRQRFGANTAWVTRDTAPLGAAQEWTHSAWSGVGTTVTLSPREERTLIRVQQQVAGLDNERTEGWLVAAFLALIPSMLAGALVAETLALGDLAGIVTLLMVFVSGVALGGPWLAAHTRRSRVNLSEQVEHIADDLARQLSRDASQPAGSPLIEAPDPHLDLSALTAPSEEAEHPSQQWRTRS